MDYKTRFDELVSIIIQKLQNDRKELRSMPKGRLRIYKQGKYLEYRQVYTFKGKRVRRGVLKDPGKMFRLARKEYLMEEIRRLEADLSAMRRVQGKLIGTDPNQIIKILPKYYENFDRQIFMDSGKLTLHPVDDPAVPVRRVRLRIDDMTPAEWGSMPYRMNTKNAENKRVLSQDGLLMRSKSESGIRELYMQMYYAHHYDELLRFGDMRLSPDFIVMRPDGKLIFHEHCGFPDDPDYMVRHFNKIALYRNYDIVEWDNLIISYEKPGGGIDMRLLRAKIESMMGI